MNPNPATNQSLIDGVHAHLQWLAEFRGMAFTATYVDSATIGRDDCCTLGQWIHGEGQVRHAFDEAYVTLRHLHRCFHAEAGRIANLINRGRNDAAVAAIASGSPLLDLSQQVEAAVRRMAASTPDRGVPKDPVQS